MKWLKHLGPAILSQSSNIPYVILEDGVRLCFDNVYYADPIPVDQDHYIQFKSHKNDIIRQSTSHFRLKNFPITIPFEDVVSLDDTVIDGRTIKVSSFNKGQPQKIAIMQSSFIKELEENEFQEIVESIQNNDHNFLLVKGETDSMDRLLESEADLIPHFGWHRSCVAIADKVCNGKSRKYCWTKWLPELSISIYGINSDEETEFISKCFDDIGIVDKEIIWI
jgi:hypothetical protein